MLGIVGVEAKSYEFAPGSGVMVSDRTGLHVTVGADRITLEYCGSKVAVRCGAVDAVVGARCSGFLPVPGAPSGARWVGASADVADSHGFTYSRSEGQSGKGEVLVSRVF